MLIDHRSRPPPVETAKRIEPKKLHHKSWLCNVVSLCCPLDTKPTGIPEGFYENYILMPTFMYYCSLVCRFVDQSDNFLTTHMHMRHA